MSKLRNLSRSVCRISFSSSIIYILFSWCLSIVLGKGWFRSGCQQLRLVHSIWEWMTSFRQWKSSWNELGYTPQEFSSCGSQRPISILGFPARHLEWSINMSDDFQASFSRSVRDAIRQTYGTRCAICLVGLPRGGGQCAHLLDQASRGADQVRINPYDKFALNIHFSACRAWCFRWPVTWLGISGVALQKMGICVRTALSAPLRTIQLSKPYSMYYALHVTCYFTPNYIVFCPSLPVLQYITNYLNGPQLALPLLGLAWGV